MPIIHHPILSYYPEVKGVYALGCVERGDGSRFRAKAHSHTHGQYAGWICYLSMKWLDCKELALHELAHILTGQGHTDKWRNKLLEIGGTLDPVPGILKNYHKKHRHSFKYTHSGDVYNFYMCLCTATQMKIRR